MNKEFIGEFEEKPGLSWVGASPWTQGYIYGLESGDVTLPNGSLVNVALDAVNGGAFSKEYSVFTSRSSVVVANRGKDLPFDFDWAKRDPNGGAHDVVLATDDIFLACGGTQGIKVITPRNPENIFGYAQTLEMPFYAYQIVKHASPKSSPFFSVSGSENSIVNFRLEQDGTLDRLTRYNFPTDAIASIAPVNGLTSSLLILTEDFRFLFVREPGESQSVISFAGKNMPGVPYKLIVENGVAVVHTSNCIIVFRGLIEHFLSPRLNTQLECVILSQEASDIFVFNDTLISLVPGGYVAYSIKNLYREPQEEILTYKFQFLPKEEKAFPQSHVFSSVN